MGSLAIFAITFFCWKLIGIFTLPAALLSLLPFVGVLIGLQDLSRVGTCLLAAVTLVWIIVPLITRIPAVAQIEPAVVQTEAAIARTINDFFGGRFGSAM